MKFHAADQNMNVNGHIVQFMGFQMIPELGEANLVHMTRPHKLCLPRPDFRDIPEGKCSFFQWVVWEKLERMMKERIIEEL
jgi:hypothetical protein